MRFTTTILSVLAATLLLSGCITTSASRWSPEERTVSMYAPVTITVEDDYTFTDYFRVSVYGNVLGYSRTAADTFETHVFKRGDEVLFVQRVIKSDRKIRFRPLLGEKVTKWDVEWRNHSYSLETEFASREFQKYLEYVPEATKVRIDIQDKLSNRYILLRTMTITPDVETELPPLPKFLKLYAQEEAPFGNPIIIR